MLTLNELMVVFGASLLLGVAGLRAKIVDKSGFAAGVTLSVVIMYFLSLEWFAPLAAFVILGGLASKYKHSVKASKGEAESKAGRGYRNILGNGGVGLMSAIAFGFYPHPAFIVAYLCSIAAMCADTLGAEIGQLSREKPVLITSLKKVKTGTDGGVTVLGEAAELVGAFLISVIPFLLGAASLKLVIVSTLAGFFGSNFDSLVGATLERRGIVDKHLTNFLGALFAAVLGIALYAYFFGFASVTYYAASMGGC